MKTFKELIDNLVELTVGARERNTAGEIMKGKQERR